MEELVGKIALVTGGARGIGKSIATRLANEGCIVAITDIDQKGIDHVVSEIKKLGKEVLGVKADVSVGEDVDRLIKHVLDTYKHIDILVNNAGITRDNLLMRMTEEEWDLVLTVNLKGAFLCTQKVIRNMMKQRSGKIINISSVVGIMGNAGQCNYAASKAGLLGFTKSVAREVASRNIQVNAIAPGYIETEMTAGLPDEIKETFISSIPAKRPGSADDVACVVSFLSSSAADYITGQVIHVDGGLLMA